MINFEEELKRIFGDRLEGHTQRDDELVEYRLKPGETASAAELAEVAKLPKGKRADLEELRADLDALTAELKAKGIIE